MKNSTYHQMICSVVKIFLVITCSVQVLYAEEECLQKAWQALNVEKYEEAIKFSDQCIKNYGNQADKQQTILEATNEPGPPVGEIDEATKTKILGWRVLNDVATAYFIKGRSFEELYFQDKAQNVEYKRMAEEMYKTCCQYTYARTWDPEGWVWSPCEVSKERLEGDLLYDGSIWRAANRGDLARVKQLVETENADVNSKAPDGWTPLHYAAQKGHLDIVKYLIQKGAHVDAKEQMQGGWTPLLTAANNFSQIPNGNFDVIKYLVENQADVNATIESGQNVLDLAIPVTTPEVVKYLIQKGLHTKVEEHTFHMAVLSGKIELVKLLLEHNTNMNTREGAGEAALMLAIKLGHIEIVKLLLDQGTEMNVKNDDVLMSLHLAVNQHLADKDRQYICEFLNNLGGVYSDLGQDQRALGSYKQALTINRELDDRKREGMNLYNIGNAYSDMEQYQQALESYKQALEIYRKIGDRKGEGNTLSNIGNAYNYLGQYPQALAYYDQALAIHREIGDRTGEGGDLHNIGVVCDKLGQYQQALEYHEQALTIARKFDDREGEGAALVSIGNVYGDLGLSQRALVYYDQALAIKPEPNRQDFALDLRNRGVQYAKMGQAERALEYFEQALTIYRELGEKLEEGAVLENLGTTYSALGLFQQGLTYLNQALTIARELDNRPSEGIILLNLGTLYYEMKQLQEASRTLQDSINIFQDIGRPDGLWPAQRWLASIAVELKQPESAVIHYEQALDTIEQVRGGLTEKEHKLSFIQNKLDVYDELIDLLQDLHKQHPDKGYDRKALEIFERKQGRVFLEEMGKSGARLFAGIPEDITQHEADLENQLTQTREQLADERSKLITEQNKDLIREFEVREQKLIAEQQALQEQIKTEYPNYYALKYPKPVELTDLRQNVLQPGELLLIYSVMKDHTISWIVSQSQFRLIPIGLSEIDLQKAIETFRATPNAIIDAVNNKQPLKAIQLANETVDDMAQQGHALYQQLFTETVRPLLAEAQTLYIVPTGPLYGLPFEALVTKAPEAGEQPHYLIQDHPVSYLSSASLLKILRDAQARRKQTTK